MKLLAIADTITSYDEMKKKMYFPTFCYFIGECKIKSI